MIIIGLFYYIRVSRGWSFQLDMRGAMSRILLACQFDLKSHWTYSAMVSVCYSMRVAIWYPSICNVMVAGMWLGIGRHRSLIDFILSWQRRQMQSNPGRLNPVHPQFKVACFTTRALSIVIVSVNQSINQSINESINQPIYF